jgi:hypothetical protein
MPLPITKSPSHKKRKPTRKASPNRSLQSEAAHRLAIDETPTVVTPSLITQTQSQDAFDNDSGILLLPPPSSPLIDGHKTALELLPSPKANDKRALADLVSGYKPSGRYKALMQHKESSKKMRVAKLNDNVLFTFL